MKEIWKDIKDFEGLYQVSNLGRVKSLGKSWDLQNGKSFSKPEKIMIGGFNTFGYRHVTLMKNNKQYCKKIHRLVAEAFLDNPNNYPQVNHKNGIKTDNYVSNLEWCNQSHNMQHALSIGLKTMRTCENASRAILTNAQVLEIRQLKDKLTGIEIAKIYGVSKHTIYNIFTNRTWYDLN